jgi:hypothetical protein
MTIIWPWRAPHYFSCGGTCHHGPPPKLFQEGHLGTENISSSFSFQWIPKLHPWDPHGFSMDFPSGLAKEWQTFCQMQQMSKNVLQFLSCMFLLSSGCFKCQHPSELKWKSKAMILILQAKEPKHGPDAFSWWTITRVSRHKNCWAMLRLGPTSIRQHMGIPVKCIDADQILNQDIDVLKSFFANIVRPTHLKSKLLDLLKKSCRLSIRKQRFPFGSHRIDFMIEGTGSVRLHIDYLQRTTSNPLRSYEYLPVSCTIACYIIFINQASNQWNIGKLNWIIQQNWRK